MVNFQDHSRNGVACNLKTSKEMVNIITATINTDVFIEILDSFLILSMENWFGDEDLVFRTIIHVAVEQRD